MWTCEKCGEKIEDQFDSCWKCAGPPEKIGLPLADSTRQSVRGFLLAVGLFFITWLFFGPIAGFHHMFVFGITCYLTLNGEAPQPGDYMWGEYGVKFHSGSFVIGLILWMLSVRVVFSVVGVLVKHRPPK